MTADPILRQVQALLDARRVAEAARLLASAGRSGNVTAMVDLAQWSIAGNIIPRDLGAARDLLGQSGAAAR